MHSIAICSWNEQSMLKTLFICVCQHALMKIMAMDQRKNNKQRIRKRNHEQELLS